MSSGQRHRKEREQEQRERAPVRLPMSEERYLELLDAALERRSRANIEYMNRQTPRR